VSAPTSAPTETSATHARWFTDEVHAHESQLKAYLRGSFPAVRDVEDVIQESYLRIWKARMAQPIRSTKSFLFRVARNLALDLVRRDRISPIANVVDLNALGTAGHGPGVVELACTQDEVRMLARAIHMLPVRCRQVIVLRQIDGLSQRQIALQLGISVLTVQVHVVNGLRRIEEYFREQNINRSA
jgi:RNA polymerase sigma-70 factor (ECF subfamily)